MNYYHYTNEKGARGIVEERTIRESSQLHGPDAVLGDGAYLTRMPPNKGKVEIAKNNYDDGGQFVAQKIHDGKLDYAVKVKIPASHVEKAPDGRNVYLHRGDIDLDNHKWEVKQVKKF